MYKGVPTLTINTPSSIARNIGQCNIQGNREASLSGGCGQQIYLIRKQLPEILKLLKQTSAIHFVNLTVWHIIHNFHFYMIIMDFSTGKDITTRGRTMVAAEGLENFLILMLPVPWKIHSYNQILLKQSS